MSLAPSRRALKANCAYQSIEVRVTTGEETCTISKNPFNPWTLPTRCFAAVIMAYGFSRILMTADAAGIVIAVVGSLVWQVGTALEERSSLFRRLDKTPVGSIMRIDRFPVPSWWTLAKVRKQFAAFGKLRFLVTMHDGFESGVALPQQVLAINEPEAPFVPIGVLAQPISRVNAVRRTTRCWRRSQ